MQIVVKPKPFALKSVCKCFSPRRNEKFAKRKLVWGKNHIGDVWKLHVTEISNLNSFRQSLFVPRNKFPCITLLTVQHQMVTVTIRKRTNEWKKKLKPFKHTFCRLIDWMIDWLFDWLIFWIFPIDIVAVAAAWKYGSFGGGAYGACHISRSEIYTVMLPTTTTVIEWEGMQLWLLE